jgi:CheY-like chemotaxis protein
VSGTTASVILCVDDNPDILFTRKLVLETYGYRVISASCSEEALSIFRSTQIDLVITDHVLPTKSGGELCSEIKAISHDTPVIVISGLIEFSHECPEADMAITKGSVEKLLAGVRKLLGEKALGQSG